MHPNGSSQNSANFSVPQNQSRLIFDRFSRSISRLPKELSPENVHHFRTNSRRVEAVVGQLTPETRNKRKLLKLLAKLRKKAGKLRDIDVQTIFLKNQKVTDRQDHRAQMLELLAEDRVRRSKKLAKAADRETIAELRKRLRREQAQIDFHQIDPLQLALVCLPKPGQVGITEKTLHAFRIAAKRARYLGELAGDSAEAKFFVQELKRAQDAIGEWHDILKLKQKAERRFGSASDSALVSLLQNVSRARFRNAAATLNSVLATLAQPKQPAEAAETLAEPAEKLTEKPAASIAIARSAAVA